MNIKHTITATVLAGTLALTSATGVVAAQRPGSLEPTPTTEVTRTPRNKTNTSETRPSGTNTSDNSDRVKREGSGRTSSTTSLRGEGSWEYESIRGFDFVMATRSDYGTARSATFGLEAFSDPYFWSAYTDFILVDSFSIRGLEECVALELSYEFSTVYFIVCQDGAYLNSVIGTDLNATIEVMDQMDAGDVPTAPVGYERSRG